MKRTTSSSTRVSSGSIQAFSCRAVENSRSGASSKLSTACTPGTLSAARLVDRDDSGVRMRRAQHLDVQQAFDRGIEGVARRAAHHLRSGGRRQAAAEGGAGGGVFDIGLAVECVLDRAVAGAAAQIAFQRRAEILPLRLVQRCAGQDHAGGAEAALKGLRIEKRLLHRMRAAVRREAFDGGDGVAVGAEGRDQAAMHRLAVDQHGAGAAVAGVAAFLDAEMPEFAQESPQALSGVRALRELLAVDLKASWSRRALQFAADFFGKPQRHVLAPRRLAVNVVVVELVGDALQDRLAQFARVRDSGKGQSEPAASSMPSPSVPWRRRCRCCRSAAPPTGRPASAKSGETPSAASAPRAGYRSAASRSPGASTLRWLPVTKSATAIFCSPPSAFQIVQTPSSAAVSEIIGPAGNDMQRLPPTVAVFQILKEARNARQHWLIRGAASHSGGQASASSCATVQVAAIVSSVSPIVSAGHLRSVRSISRRQMDLRFREQPGPAREPSIACRPNGQLRPRLRVSNFGDGVQIHGYANAFNEMHLPVRSLARPTPTLLTDWAGL